MTTTLLDLIPSQDLGALNPDLDAHDLAALTSSDAARRARLNARHPALGEWLRDPDGRLRRVAHVHDYAFDGRTIQLVQPTRSRFGGPSFYLSPGGHPDMSGALGSGIGFDAFTLTAETMPARVWIWHHGRRAAANGVDCLVPFRVWDCTQPLDT